MAKEIDLSTFEAPTLPSSASPVLSALEDTVQGECIHTPTECNAQDESASYSIEQIASICGVARRTAFKYAAEVIEVHFWLKEADFRINGIYNSVALTEIKRRKTYGKLEDYRQAVHAAKAEEIATHQSQQQPEAPQSNELATTEVVEEPTVSEITRIRENRYYVPDSGSNRLARAQETRQSQRFNLNDTRQRVQQAFLGLAVQTHENEQAKEIEREADKEQSFEKAYVDELERIQIENAAREAARADYAAFQEQVRMGNVPAPTASSASV